MYFTYILEFLRDHAERLVDLFCRPCDGDDALGTRTVRNVYLGAAL